MSNLYQASLLNKLMLLSNRGPQLNCQPSPFQLPGAINPRIFPTFQNTGLVAQNQLLPMNNVFTPIQSSALGKHSCFIRAPALMMPQFKQPVINQNLLTSLANLRLVLPNPQIIEKFPHGLSRVSLVTPLNTTSKKINKQPLNESPKRKRSVPVKKIVYLPKKKKFRKFASQIVRAFKCSVLGCTKAYGCENSLKAHIKIKHKEYDSEQAIEPVSLKTEEDSSNL